MKPTLYPILGLLFLLLVAGCAQPPVQTPTSPETPVVDPTPPVQEEPIVPIPPVEETPEPVPVTETPPEPTPAPTPEFVLPQVTTEGAYAGTLVDAHLFTENMTIAKQMENMNRNGVHALIGYFSIPEDVDPNKLTSTESLGLLVDMVQKNPGRIIPFFSFEIEEEASTIMPDNAFVQRHQEAYTLISEVAGENIVKGVGELEQHEWDKEANTTRMLKMATFAQDNELHVMFHPPRGEMDAIGELTQLYPETTFIIHQFADDFEADSGWVIELLKENPNVYYSIDVDQMTYDVSMDFGLLHEFEDIPSNMAAAQFVNKYAEKKDLLFGRAVARYYDLVKAVPDKVLWGTDAGPKYNFEPEVYDRVIEFTREFIAAMPEEAQEKLAYQNAWKIFGPGVTLEKEISISYPSE